MYAGSTVQCKVCTLCKSTIYYRMYCYFLLIVRVIEWGYINEYLKYNESTVNTQVCTGIVEVDIC